MIYAFKQSYIQLLKNIYSFQGKTQILNNPRYYVSGVKINDEDLFICIPLHSNGKYFMSIDNPLSSSGSNHWKNHGLNFEKMLILTKSEFDTYNDGHRYVESNVIDDINNKADEIAKGCKKYLKKYLVAYSKKVNNQLLSREEQNILNFSSLNSFDEKVKLLLKIDIESMVLQDVGQISDTTK